MFRRLPPFGGDQRAVAEILNGVMDGKTNNTGTITLATGNATTTTLYDERISPDTKIVLIPFSDAAEADSAPYGAFHDETDQAATTISASYPMKYDSTDLTNGVYVSNNSRINVRNDGVYNIQFSSQFKNTDNDGHDVDIWFRINGNDVTDSNSKFHIPARKSSGAASHLIAALNIFLDLNAGDYVEIVWRTSNVAVTMEHFAAVNASAGVTPAIPATPSVIVTVCYVAPFAYSNVYVSSQTKGEATISHFANSTADKTYAYILVG